MKIAFFETQDWEKPILKSSLKKNSLSFFSEPLSLENVSKVKDAEVISVFVYSKINSEILSNLPKLKLITTRSTGFDHIDVAECKKRKIKVTNVPTYGENTVAEHAFALILALSRKVHKSYVRTLKDDYSIDGLMGFDLKGKTLGVIGAGNIGKHVIRIARGFEMNVLVSDRHEDEFLAEQLNFKYVSLKTLFKNSDIITLHIPYNEKNHHFINKKTLRLFKKGSILINTARGQLVDTEALIYALDKKILSGIGLDVIEGENFVKEEKQLLQEKNREEAIKTFFEDRKLIDDDRVVFTPHIAFYSREALERITQKTMENVIDFTKGKLNGDSTVC